MLTNPAGKKRQWYEKNKARILAKQKDWRQRNLGSVQSRMRKYYEKNKADFRFRNLLRNYGISREEFDCLFESQGRACAICRETDFTKNAPHVDHDHDTGAIRAILCHKCNYIIGFSRENPDILRAAAEYLVATASSKVIQLDKGDQSCSQTPFLF